MAGDAVDIDLYANLEEGFDQEGEYNHDGDLYDDVITAPSGQDGAENESRSTKSSPTMLGTTYQGRRISLYVGNMTWWTTDQDLTDAITSLGVSDLVEIKFYENRANGQSKGYAVVVIGSENSSRMIFDKLPKRELHGQVPVVTPCNRQALNQFEAQARKGEPPPQNGSGDMRNREGPPPGPPPSHVRGPPPRPPRGPPGKPGFPPKQERPPGRLPPGGPPGLPPPGHPPPPFAGGPPRPGHHPPPGLPPNVGPPGSLPPRSGPPPISPVRGPPPGVRGPPPPHLRGPPPRPDWNRPPAPFPGGGPPPPQPVPPPGLRGPPPGLPPPHSQPPPGGPPPGHYLPPAPHVNPAFFPHQQPPPMGIPPIAPNPDPYSRPPPPVSYQNDYLRTPPERPASPGLSDQEFEEIFQRNKTVSSSAISRAVQDASAGDFASAIETLVTAISLIKQSKIASDDRCKILISSLQDTLHGIEEKSYGSKAPRTRSRSRERDRDSDRERGKRSRSHRSRRDIESIFVHTI
ncbi:hypothetical protein ScPMuIL_016195 [Solemya velum]